MNVNNTLKVLELDKILSMLADETSCEDAYNNAKEIKPLHNISDVNLILKETYDAHMLIGRFGSPSFGSITNVNNSLSRAQAGGILSMSELIKISNVLTSFRMLREWRLRSENLQTSLDDYINNVIPNKYFEDKIKTSIVSDEEMADTASSTLADIRRKIRASSSKVRQQLDKLVRSQAYQKFLQDPIVTIRGNRFVVPVKAEYRSEIPGLVHDTSSSGSTVFVEPMSVVDINNELKVLYSKETAEIERILREFSMEAGEFASSILSSYKELIRLNVIFAKAKLAYKMKASIPIMNDKGIINIKKARHPLINNSKVVATDIYLGIDFDSLVITGPNTGGKTVTLKTIGLFTLMAMCGLMIPAYDNSELSVFNKVLVSIGDEQSIEQSLSTFSSHMINIIDILKEADEKSLVLLDELGAGTDPIEGAALAVSILERLKLEGAKIVATTHYSELKSYALQSSRVENASCEFDVKTLRPTYKLLIGIPGRSNAFVISERLGIEHSIIERAKELVSAEDVKFEEVIQKLEDSRQELELNKLKAEEMHKEALRVQREANQLLEKVKNEANSQIERAQYEAKNLLDRTRIQANSILDELEKFKKDKKMFDATAKSKLNAELRAMEEIADPIRDKGETQYKLPRKLKKGDNVLIFDIDKKGIVLEEEDSSGNVLVQAGIIKTRIPIKNLRLLEETKSKKVYGYSKRNVKSVADAKVETTLDLRGKYAFDAILELDQCIDSAILSGVNQLTVIHGKGTGVLRKEVHAHLKKHPSVRSYRLGVFGEGESGVTIIELK